MPFDTPKPIKYQLLETLLAHKGQQLQGTYSLHDVASIFGVSVRAIQVRMKRGQLNPRNLPGHAKFLPSDLEEFLRNSSKRPVAA